MKKIIAIAAFLLALFVGTAGAGTLTKEEKEKNGTELLNLYKAKKLFEKNYCETKGFEVARNVNKAKARCDHEWEKTRQGKRMTELMMKMVSK